MRAQRGPLGLVARALHKLLDEIFTRGKRVKVPAEAMLTFQLEKRLNLYPVQRSRWQNGASS